MIDYLKNLRCFFLGHRGEVFTENSRWGLLHTYSCNRCKHKEILKDSHE